MRALVQRVKRASVSVEGTLVAATGPGLLVYVGIGAGDDLAALEWLATKVVNIRIFADEHGKMTHSLQTSKGEALIVSQFTLYGDTSKGNRPSFTSAEVPERAREMFDAFCDACARHVPVRRGIFAADMQVESVNDGPVTLWLTRD